MATRRGDAKERLLHSLKTKGSQTATALARRMGVTPMAIRQHLAALETERLVTFHDERGRVGRPRRVSLPDRRPPGRDARRGGPVPQALKR